MSRRCKMTVYGIIGIFIIVIAAFLIKLFFFSGLFKPLLTLKGEQKMEVAVNSSFRDPGVKARFRFQNIDERVIVTGKINMKKLGKYKLTYRCKDSDVKVQRIVSVVDQQKPKIILKGNQKMNVFLGGTYEEPGYQITDNMDGDISANVQIKNKVNMHKLGTYIIEYQARDASGNASKIKRYVKVCPDPVMKKLHYDYDTYDNKMEEWWFRKSEKHQRMTAAQPASLLKKYNAFYMGPKEKVIYLTFDEGGSEITYIKEIAEVLKQNDVVATYFLTRNYIKSEADFVNKVIKDGNIIGNHTWHHYDMTTLANANHVDKFVKEITETEKTYMEVTGQPMKKVFRFPKGGSSERAMKMVQDLGYSTYNWSHAYYDFAGDVSAQQALKTMLDHYHEGAIYLLHPNNKGNFEAIDSFIKEMKQQGYTFKTIDKVRENVKK